MRDLYSSQGSNATEDAGVIHLNTCSLRTGGSRHGFYELAIFRLIDHATRPRHDPNAAGSSTPPQGPCRLT